MGPTWGPPGNYQPQMGPNFGPMNLIIKEATDDRRMRTSSNQHWPLTAFLLLPGTRLHWLESCLCPLYWAPPMPCQTGNLGSLVFWEDEVWLLSQCGVVIRAVSGLTDAIDPDLWTCNGYWSSFVSSQLLVDGVKIKSPEIPATVSVHRYCFNIKLSFPVIGIPIIR